LIEENKEDSETGALKRAREEKNRLEDSLRRHCQDY